MEKWSIVKGFEDYEVSNTGRIFRKDTLIVREVYGDYILPGKELSLSYDKDGYLKTALRRESKRHYFRVHRIVAEAFLNNPANLPFINHKNGVKDDNHVDNLEWCTASYNTKHSFEVLGREGQNGGMNEPAMQLDAETLEELAIYDSMTKAGEAVGVSKVTISACVNGRLQTAGKFKWKRVGEGVSTIESA